MSKPVPVDIMCSHHTPIISTLTLTSQSKVVPAMSSKVSHDPKVFWKVKTEPIYQRPPFLDIVDDAPASGPFISHQVLEYIDDTMDDKRDEMKQALISFNFVMKELRDKFGQSKPDILAEHKPINYLGCSGSAAANKVIKTEEFVDQENKTTTSPSPLAKDWTNLLLQLRRDSGQ